MPTTFHSPKYRQLVVKMGRERVQFALGEAEVPDHLVEPLADFAERHPEFEIERGEATEVRMTAKQAAKAEAESLGLDSSGTTAEIQARIDAHKAASDGQGEGESDSEESSDQTDESDSDGAGDGESSEADEN